LSRCIECLQAQTYKRIEIILVNDGSTDKSSSICDDYASQDSRIIVIQNKNSGPSAARNLGISQANGRYLMFVDADDYVDESIVQVLVETLESNRVDLAVCSYTTHLFNAGIESRINCCHIKSEKISADAFLNLSTLETNDLISTRGRAHIAGNVWGKMYLSDLIKENHLRFDENLFRYEDISFNLCYLSIANEISVSGETLYHYCVNIDHLSLSDMVTRRKFEMLVTSYDISLNKLKGRQCDYVKYYYSYIVIGYLVRLFQAESPFSFSEAYAEVKSVCMSSIYVSVMKYYHKPKGGSQLIPILLRLRLYLLVACVAKTRMLIAGFSNIPIRQWCFSNDSKPLRSRRRIVHSALDYTARVKRVFQRMR